MTPKVALFVTSLGDHASTSGTVAWCNTSGHTMDISPCCHFQHLDFKDNL